jgi:hypothetical protein
MQVYCSGFPVIPMLGCHDIRHRIWPVTFCNKSYLRLPTHWNTHTLRNGFSVFFSYSPFGIKTNLPHNFTSRQSTTTNCQHITSASNLLPRPVTLKHHLERRVLINIWCEYPICMSPGSLVVLNPWLAPLASESFPPTFYLVVLGSLQPIE